MVSIVADHTHAESKASKLGNSSISEWVGGWVSDKESAQDGGGGGGSVPGVEDVGLDDLQAQQVPTRVVHCV